VLPALVRRLRNSTWRGAHDAPHCGTRTVSPKTPCRVELLGAPQGENGKRPRAYGFYSILSTAFRTFAARSTQYAAPLPAFTQSCFFPDIWLDGVRAGPFDHFSMRCEPNAAALARMTNELFQYPDA